MSNTIDVMLNYFSQTKLAGSYFLLFLVSIVLLYYISKEKNVWFILYGVVLLIVVVMDPIVVWALMQIFPALNTYAPLTLMIPVLLYVPFAVTELIDSVNDSTKKHFLILIMVLLISVCGNLFGVFKEYSVSDDSILTSEEQQIIDNLNELQPQLLLADESMIHAVSTYGNALPLLYGRDLWTANMDTGIMDGYNEEAYSFFDAMKNTEENVDYIVDTAYEYSCDVLLLDNYEGSPKRIGKYTKVLETDNYVIYKQQ